MCLYVTGLAELFTAMHCVRDEEQAKRGTGPGLPRIKHPGPAIVLPMRGLHL